jgi:predicted DsbA family dithiol-disulfide isomerase
VTETLASHHDDSSTKEFPLRLEIYSDIACPWCYLGLTRFFLAYDASPLVDRMPIVYRSYQLDPSTPTEEPRPHREVLAAKFQTTPDQVDHMHQRIADLGSAIGLHYDFGSVRGVNTFDGHRLIHLAASLKRARATKLALLKAYFEEGASLTDRTTLIRIGESAGIDGTAVQEMLASDHYADAVRADISRANEFGISGVPTFLFLFDGEHYALSGAQEIEVFAQVLDKLHVLVSEA